LLAIFLVSFGIMWTERKAEEPVVSNPIVPAPDNTAPITEAAGVAAVARTNPIASPAEDAGFSGPAPSSTASNAGALELPVEMHFRNRADQGKIQGSILNNSGDELVIDAIVFSPSTKETGKFQLTVAPYSGKSFGLDDGLDMRPGDQITLKSSPYRDKVGRIP